MTAIAAEAARSATLPAEPGLSRPRVGPGAARGAEGPLRASRLLDAHGGFLAPPTPLSARHVEVLDLLAGGLTNQLIAMRLHRSPDWVKDCVSDMLDAWQVEGRTGLVGRGFVYGVLDVSPLSGGSLTRKQCRALALAGRDLTREQIAAAMYVSPDRAREVLFRGCRVLGAANRAQGVALAVRTGQVPVAALVPPSLLAVCRG